MVMDVLSAADRQKIDGSDDALFYAEPRFVQHLDAAFRARLTELYRERIPRNAVVLDLMGSWVSHLPEDGTYAEVIGHGLNERELQANPRLSRHWVQNLNTNQHLPLDDGSVDAALVVAGWQYLQQPEAIAAELLRVVRPGGALIIAFSNRMFAQKAPRIWLEGTDRDRLASVARVLIAPPPGHGAETHDQSTLAEILTRTEFLSARADGDGWLAAIRPPGDAENGVGAQTVSARAIVNAAGPWVKQVMERRLGQTARGNVRHVKGSHIVVPRLHQQRHAFLLQNPDRRIVFVIPYERDFTLIGTTDIPVTARDLDTGITPEEIAYLCEAASRYTAQPITPESVVWSYSGVRPLYDDGTDDPSSVTRDYHFEMSESGPPLLSVFGGKITTYRC